MAAYPEYHKAFQIKRLRPENDLSPSVQEIAQHFCIDLASLKMRQTEIKPSTHTLRTNLSFGNAPRFLPGSMFGLETSCQFVNWSQMPKESACGRGINGNVYCFPLALSPRHNQGREHA